jgi:hypothetical protein
MAGRKSISPRLNYAGCSTAFHNMVPEQSSVFFPNETGAFIKKRPGFVQTLAYFWR